MKSLFRRIRIDKLDESIEIPEEEENFRESLAKESKLKQDYTVKLGQWMFIPKFKCLK